MLFRSRIFNAHTGRAAQVKLETAGIDAGEEILAEPWKDKRKRSQTGYKEPYQECPPVMETTLQHSAIAITKGLET